MKRRFVLASIVAAALFAAPAVQAQSANAGATIAAEQLFQEGRKAALAKRYGDACPKFLASQRLSPALGTLMNLADCYEKNNQLASAWASFHEAIAVAQRLNRKDREKTARERSDDIEPKLIKLSILSRASGIDVRLDGSGLDSAALTTAIPVDAGKHTVEATAKGKKPFTATVEVNDKNKAPSVEIPPLEDAPADQTTQPVTPPPVTEHHGWSTQKTLGLVVGGVGVVGLAVGGIFGLKTASTWSDAKSHCTGLECNQTGVQLATDAKNSGNVATIATIAGGVLLVGGAVLFFTGGNTSSKSSGQTPTTWRVGMGPGSVSLGGTFR